MVGNSDVTIASTSTNDICALEPIHIPGAIQPHGLLVGLDSVTLGLVVKSANVDVAFPDSPFLSAPPWLPPTVAEACRCLVRDGREELTLRADIPEIGPTQVHCFATPDVLFCEFELSSGQSAAPDLEAVSLIVSDAHDRMDAAEDAAMLASVIADAVRKVSGFERVMVYRFDGDGNGEVVGESLVADWRQSFQGMRFPASDIPEQARALYRRTAARWLPTRDYEPVPLVSPQDHGGKQYDLSLSRFRSVSPVHRLYEKNIGVDGAMSVSIIQDGGLWGLVIGNHRQPHRVPAAIRNQVAAMARFFAARLDAVLKREAKRETMRDTLAYSAMLGKLAAADDFLTALTEGTPSVLDMFPGCTGAAVVWDSDGATAAVRTLGAVPPDDQLAALRDGIRALADGPVFATDRLSELFPRLEAFQSNASGVMAMFFDDGRNPALLLFRPEIVQSVSWAGKPEKVVGPDGVPNLPRQSFDRWTEITRGHSRPWRPWETDIAATVCTTVNDVIVRQMRRIRALDVEVGRFAQALTLSGTTLSHQDLGLRYLWIHNPHVGFAPEIVGLTDGEVFEANFASRLVAIKRRVLGTGVGERAAMPYATDDLWAEWFDISVEPLVDQGGAIIGLSCATVRITESKRSEALVIEYGNRLQTTLDSLPDLVWQKDADGVYTFCNHMFELFVGRPSAEIIGKNDFDLVDADLATFFRENDRKAVVTGKATSNEEWITFAHDGRRALLETIKTPICGDDGKLVGVLGIGREVTKIRAAEQAAQEASRSKSAFLSNTSHEIRTPLNVIIGFANRLRSDLKDTEHADRLSKIDRAANHLLGIISEILDMSKIEAGQMQIDARDFGLRAMLTNVMSQISSQAEAKGLDARLDIAAGIPDCLHGDAVRISQCLINYGGNAVKFTRSGAVTVRVVLDSRIGNALMLRFAVEDSGVGIAPEVLPRLFSPFEQADKSTTREFGGTGLGLALTKRFTELMGGEVGVESVPGSGSRFWFTVLVHPGDGKTDGDAPVADASIVLTEKFRGSRLLVAEDMELNREVLHDLLERTGLTFDMAEDGEVAVAMASAAAYDLILMDMQMPIMDGLSATQAIRKLPGYAGTPIIALTANAFDEDRRRCLAAGMNDFLSKPIRSEVLHATLLTWLGGDGAHPPSAVAPEPADTARSGVPASVGPFAIAELLDNVDGNRALALRLLGTFRETFEGSGVKLERFVDLESLERAEHLAHAIKGVAGQMAANALRQAAGDLEAALRALPSQVQTLSATLDEAMAAVGRLAVALKSATESASESTEGVNSITDETDTTALRSSVPLDDEGGPTLTDLQAMLQGYVSGT